MQKEKSVKSYTRRTKSGKTVVVHAYKAKYDAAEEMRKALAKKEGAGKELANKKKQVEQPIPDNKLGFSAEEFKAWYHWDMVNDPKNKAALKVEKALKKSMGVKAYNKFLDDMTDGYSARGHNKAFKGLESSQNKETTKSKPTSKDTSTKGNASTNHVTDEDGRKHSTKRNSLGISPAEWAAYNSGGVGIKGMSDKEVKTAIKHVESTLKKTLGSKVKSFKEYLDDSAQGGGDFKADMKKLQGIMSAKGSRTERAQNTPTDEPRTYGQAFKRAKDNFKKRKEATKDTYEKPTDIKSLQSKGWKVHGREFPSLRSKKAPVAYLVSPDGKKMYTLSAGINPIGGRMEAIWTLSRKAELQDTPTSIRKKFEK